MNKTSTLPLATALALQLAMLSLAADAQVSAPGRTAFDQSGCRACHAYSSRRGAPSVRDMLATLEGEPERALKGIDGVETHGPEFAANPVSHDDRKLIAEWLSGARFPEPVATAPKPAPSSPPTSESAPRPASAGMTPALPVVVPPVVVQPLAATPSAPRRAETSSAPTPSRTAQVTGIALQPGKASDQLVISLAGRQPEGLDIKSSDGKLVITLPGLALASDLPTRIAASKSARVVSTIEATREDGALVLSVTPRSGEIKYNAIQGRNRLAIEMTAIPQKNKEALASAEKSKSAKAAVSKGKPAQAAPAKPAVALPSAGAVALASMAKDIAVESSAAAAESAAKATAKASADAEARAKREAEAAAAAKKDAEMRAKKDAEALAQANAKKEQESRQARDASDAAKKELELMAALKASAAALQGGTSAEGRPAKRDHSKMKAPEKFRDEPCPPLADSDPIGTVDEARAKDIIDRVGCPQCHAFVQKKTGPPFKRVFEKMKGNPSCVIRNLKKNKEHNDEGVTEDLKGSEFKIVADYIATRAK